MQLCISCCQNYCAKVGIFFVNKKHSDANISKEYFEISVRDNTDQTDLPDLPGVELLELLGALSFISISGESL